jgi:N-sulfoglucosamine sulfohydrolase
MRTKTVCAWFWSFMTVAAWPGGLVAAERPNILWISAEDLSAGTLGCYGGPARTPRLDALATGGLRFDAAFSAAPVCAPSRSGIITGVMPTTLGSLPMRCRATPPPHVAGLPALLHEAGYYCTNNAKTDYNFAKSFEAGWDESGNKAHWRGRPDRAQPFFAVFNLGVTHESGLFGDRPEKVRAGLPAARRADPARVEVPPYYPDTPVIRQALAHRLDLAAALDDDVGRILDQLATDGFSDSTIVVFWGDHGEGIPHGKRFLTEHGLRVPLIVHCPPRFAARARLAGDGPSAGTTEHLVSLLDLAPTMLDLAGAAIPAWMEGRSFLGPHAARRETVVGVADRMDAAPGFGRSVRDARFRYVRNFMPWLDGDDLPDYAAGVPITGELRRVRAAGGLPPGAEWFGRTSRPTEELYDVVADPDQLHNLATSPAHQADLQRLRQELLAWMRATRDTGVLAEPILRREARDAGSEWAVFHPNADRDAAAAARYDAIQAAAWDAAEQPPLDALAARLTSDDPAVRFWAVRGVTWAARQTGDTAVATRLAPLLADPDPVVRVEAARWVAASGATALPEALDCLAAGLATADPDLRVMTLVAVDQLGERGRPLWKAAADVDAQQETYASRTIERIRSRLAGEAAIAP